MEYTYELFSNWLIIWFLLYYFKIINASPLIFLILALIGVIYIQIFYIKKIIFKNIIINVIIKLIPSILIFKVPIIEEIDLLLGFILIYIYVVILLINNKNPIDIYLKFMLKILKNN